MEEVTGENIQELTFDAALERLEEKVRQLEGGRLPLEEAIECFKEGISLVRVCASKLKHAETTIQRLIQDDDGIVIETSFEGPVGGELE